MSLSARGHGKQVTLLFDLVTKVKLLLNLRLFDEVRSILSRPIRFSFFSVHFFVISDVVFP